MASALITMPKAARAGDVIEVRALVQHAMETGYRRSSEGALLPRDLIRRFTCSFVEGTGQSVSTSDGSSKPGSRLVFAATLHAAVAANPYFAFHFRAERSGTLIFIWTGDNGFAHREQVNLLVT
ncbi:thiosulfate oxidation carrier complex protein SoxZ [Casimicrobium huifangae]|uniref:thiosulfate oxidation carrier complex protein SoxZ n=2 Tax=Casimicrobium huifangae TaxID=2591109 RepID=UPI002CC3DE73|nr:thiosulfate oxidation carrier complex protein SoxZ [Casimicrobium huifangae]